MPSVTAESMDNDQMGVYRYTLRAQSTFYPQLFYDRLLIVTIDECIVTAFEFDTALGDIEYVVNSAPVVSVILPFIIEPACSFAVAYRVD